MDMFSISVRIIRTGVFSSEELGMTADEMKDFVL